MVYKLFAFSSKWQKCCSFVALVSAWQQPDQLPGDGES
jgi:hypothetical protein